jgi:hypothetical protein
MPTEVDLIGEKTVLPEIGRTLHITTINLTWARRDLYQLTYWYNPALYGAMILTRDGEEHVTF